MLDGIRLTDIYDENFVSACGNPLTGNPIAGCSGGKVVEERYRLKRDDGARQSATAC